MAITPILAMTAAEIHNCSSLPPKYAWMACHFSSSGPGLTNLPEALSAGSLVILDDSVPMNGHDPEQIGTQLARCDADLVLLDLQRPAHKEAAGLVSYLAEALPCPVVVSELYAKENTLPVFLSPHPPSLSLREWISPWTDREIWLDLAPSREHLRLTENGCQVLPLDGIPEDERCFPEEFLHCHYQIQKAEKNMDFLLWRTDNDLKQLLEEAETLGIRNAVGLWQELNGFR